MKRSNNSEKRLLFLFFFLFRFFSLSQLLPFLKILFRPPIKPNYLKIWMSHSVYMAEVEIINSTAMNCNSFFSFNLNKLMKSFNISFSQIFTITKNITQDDHRPRCFSKAAQKYKWHSTWTSKQGKVEIKFDKRCCGTTLWYSHTKTACGRIVHSDTKRKMFADIAFDNVSFGRFSQSSQKHQGNHREKERVRKQRRRTSL